MLNFADSFLPWTAATLAPAFVGLLLIVLAGMKLQARYLAAFAFGILFWFFVDTVKEATSLGVDSGFSGGVAQVALVGLFILGVISFFSNDRNRNIFSPELAIGKYGMAIPLLVAVALGVHGLGEGAAFGGTAAITKSTSLLDAFGGISGGVAYVLHKALEPMIVGACYCAYSIQHARNTTGRLRDVTMLSIVFAVPSLVGAATGYYLTYDGSYFYALGTGTAIYATVRLLGPLFNKANATGSRESVTMAMLITLGFLTIYFAALFHSS
jgi:hypothetical protein